MVQVSAKNARAHFSDLLDQVEDGEEIVIIRHGKPVARLVGNFAKRWKFPDLSDFRKTIKVRGRPTSRLVIHERQERL